jgi:small subunit ribosomal protein S1
MAKSKATTDEAQYSDLQNYLDTLAQPPKSFKKGQIIKGLIVNINPGEIVVNVGGRTEGVVTGREMKLEGEKLDKQPGDEILVYVVKPENDKGQIELSIRRTGMARKWYELNQAKEHDTPVEVTVIEANTGGVIVEIFGGLRGFVPSSQLKNSRIYPSGNYVSKEDATQQLQSRLAELIDEKLQVMVIEIDREKNRVILSEKLVDSEADMALRKETLGKIEIGVNLEGEVTGIAPFGLFVSANGLEGLVHLSEISWDKVTNPADFYKVGEKIQVQVIGIEDSGKRIAYSIKRLQPDPWDQIIKKYTVGQIIKGEITKIVDYGAFVRIEEGLNGLIHISELSNQLVKDPTEVVKEGETRDVMVISMSKEERHLGLSIRRLTEDKDKPAKKAKKAKAEGEEDAPEMARLEELLSENEETA